MVPSLSLEYSSQSGDGIMGLGWSLTGLPSIGRCPRTVAQDSIKGSVNYDANDRFCMEGQRLVAISGTYGANGTQYRTEIEGFSKVISYGTAGTGPAYFKVWTKSGQIMEFGNTTDSRILAQGKTTARSWAANKISDTKGNYLTVTYTNDTTNGQAYPTRVDYTGNAGASLSPYNSVRFTYNTSRPDQVPMYHAGSLQKTTVLLTNVKTYEGNNVVRDYQITYELGTSLRRSRITQIKLCDGAPPTPACLAPTAFGWQGTRDALTMSTVPNAITQNYSMWAGDFTGDGLTDVLRIVKTAPNPNVCPRGNIYGGSLAGTFADAQMVDSIYGGSTPVCFNVSGPNNVLDVNGDGYPDIQDWFVVFTSSVIDWKVNNRQNGFGLSVIVSPTDPSKFCSPDYIGDFNGDGKVDYASCFSAATAYTYLNSGPGSFIQDGGHPGGATLGVLFGDFDGDGCTDALKQGSSNNLVYFCNPAVAQAAATAWLANGYTIAIGDFNGDGMADVLAARKTATGTLQLSTGTGLSASVFTVPSGWGKYAIYPADFNGDGRTDIALVAPGGSGNFGVGTPHAIWLSTGTGFVQTATITNNTAGDTTVKATIADWNNDGAADLWIQKPSGDTEYLFAYVPEFMNSVSNGLGITTTITYDRLNKPTVYTRDTDAAYPLVDIIGPFHVVSQVDSSNGIGGTYSSSYEYAGLKADHSGRGFLGFRLRIITDLQTNVVETTTFRQDFPYLGLIASQTKTRGAVTLNSKTNTFVSSSPGTGRYLVTLSQAVEASNDLNGAALPTITTSYQYDAYGNATQVSVTTPGGASKVTVSTYINDTVNWLLGRLTNSTQTNTNP